MKQMVLLIPLLLPTFVQAFTLPHHSLSLTAQNYLFSLGKVKIIEGNKGLPYELVRLKVLTSGSGACTFGWWRQVLGSEAANADGLTGKGVTVLIIDSGADDSVLKTVFGRGVNWYLNAAYIVHKNDCKRFINYKNITFCVFDTGKLDEYTVYYAVAINNDTDLTGHGTAVASVILSIAPDVTLYVAKVTAYVMIVDSEGRVLNAIPTVDPVALAYSLRRAVLGPDGFPSEDDPKVVNLSLGAVPIITGPFPDSIDNLLNYYMFEAPIANVSSREAFVVAAGNEGLSLADLPALLQQTMGVAALMYVNGTFEPTSFSNKGLGVDFASIGAGLYLPVPKYSYIASIERDPCAKTVGNATFVRLDGTSFAAPMVSGIAALWLQAGAPLGTEGIVKALKQDVVQPFSAKGTWNPTSGWGVPLAPGLESSQASSLSLPALPLASIFGIKKKKKTVLVAVALSAAAFALSVKDLAIATFLGTLGAWTSFYVFSGSSVLVALPQALINALVTISLLMISWVLADFLYRIIRKQ